MQKGKKMADYIKREDVVNLGVLMQTHLWTREQTYNAIFCLPSADVAPVVRCKDCKWYQDNATWEDFINHCKWISTETPDEYDFCSCGERKSENEER